MPNKLDCDVIKALRGIIDSGSYKNEYTLDEIASAPYLIQKIRKPTAEQCLAAIGSYDRSLPTEGYVKSNPSPTPEYYEKAVDLNYHVLRHIPAPTNDLFLRAVKNDPKAIEYIDELCPKLRMMAIMTNPDALRYAQRPTKDMQIAAVERKPMMVASYNCCDEANAIAVSKNPSLIRHIVPQPSSLQILAVEQDPKSVKYITWPTDKVQKIVIDKDWRNIEFIQNPSITTAKRVFAINQKEALKLNANLWKYIENIDPDLQLELLSHKASNIKHIQNPTVESQMLAVKEDTALIHFIKNPCREALVYVFKENSFVTFNEKPVIDFENADDEMKTLQECPLILAYAKNASPEGELLAVRTDSRAVAYVKKVTPEMHKVLLDNYK